MNPEEINSVVRAISYKWETETPIWKKEIHELKGEPLWSKKRINRDLTLITLYELKIPENLKPFFDNPNRLFDFRPESISNSFEGQIIINSSDLDRSIVTSLEQTSSYVFAQIWISPHGTQLLSRAKVADNNSLSYPSLFIELPSKGTISYGQQFLIIPPHHLFFKYSREYREYLRRFFMFSPILKIVYGFENDQQASRLISQSYLSKDEKVIPAPMAYLINLNSQFIEDEIIPKIIPLKKFLTDTFRIQETAWKSPKTLSTRHAIIDNILTIMGGKPFPNLSSTINLLSKAHENWESIKPDKDSFLSPFHTAITWLIEFCLDVLSFANSIFNELRSILDKLRNELNDMSDSLIAFFCGFWNGLVDAVEGIIDTVILFGSVLLFFLKSINDGIVNLFLEFIEEVREMGVFNFLEEALKSLAKFVKYMHEMLVDGLYTILVKMEEGDIAIDNPRVLSYYFGYTVYNIVENFLPPLKVTSKAKYLLKPLIKAI